jgi:predicted amidohydrolase YtcJ
MKTPNLILSGATVYPVIAEPIREGAVAIGDDRILAVGRSEAVEALAGASTRVVVFRRSMPSSRRSTIRTSIC